MVCEYAYELECMSVWSPSDCRSFDGDFYFLSRCTYNYLKDRWQVQAVWFWLTIWIFPKVT